MANKEERIAGIIRKSISEIITMELKKARHGGKLSLKLFPETMDLFCVIDDKKTAIAIYKYSEMGYYECVRGINREDN